MNFSHLYKSAAEINVKLISTDKKIRKSKREKEGERVENNTDEMVLMNSVSSKKARKRDKVNLAPLNNNSENVINTETAEIKPKKRNKSVSFMLDDKEEVVIKKTKSDTSANVNKRKINSENSSKKPRKKDKKALVKMENGDIEMTKKDIEPNSIGRTKSLKRNLSVKLDSEDSDPTNRKIEKKSKKNFKGKELGDSSNKNQNPGMTKSHEIIENKNRKKQFKEIVSDISTSKPDKVDPPVETKKSKKKKLPSEAQNNVTEYRPIVKSKKSEEKPEAIAGNLENLSIGDNTHTLSNLLDEMTVVDKKKQKKNKNKKKKDKQPSIEAPETEVEGSKEKEKWQKKRWNKGKKGKDDTEKGLHPVTIENLPINIMLSYKKLLTEHFAQCGTVRRIGIAELYPSENTKPVFTTTVYFDSSADVTKALEEDNTSFEGTTIRVKRPFHPLETTAVVRTYGPLSEQIISTIFSDAGRIRRIKLLVKSKKSMATAFVELDEPEAVERAIKLAEEVKVGGKNIHVTKFQLQQKAKQHNKQTKANITAKVDENKKPAVNVEGESEESND